MQRKRKKDREAKLLREAAEATEGQAAAVVHAHAPDSEHLQPLAGLVQRGAAREPVPAVRPQGRPKASSTKVAVEPRSNGITKRGLKAVYRVRAYDTRQV